MGSAMAPLERTMLVSCRLSIVTLALSVTIRPQFAIECLRRSNLTVCFRQHDRWFFNHSLQAASELFWP